MSTKAMFKELTIVVLLPYSIAVFYRLCEEVGERQACQEKILLTDCVLHCQKQKLATHFSEDLNKCCCQAHGMSLLRSKDKEKREVVKGIHDCDVHQHNDNTQPFTICNLIFLQPLHFLSCICHMYLTIHQSKIMVFNNHPNHNVLTKHLPK